MIEVEYKCVMCQCEFVKTASTEDEIKALQKTLWTNPVCQVCFNRDCYWDE